MRIPDLKEGEEMKKVIVCLLFLLMMILTAGCGASVNVSVETDNDDGSKSVNYDFTAAELAKYIRDNVEFTDAMDTVDNSVLFEVYELDSSKVADACSYFSTGATAEEITVMTANDSNLDDNITAISDAYNVRVLNQIEGFTAYSPQEVVKLSNPLIMEVGNTVVMVICNDRDSAKQVILDYIK